MCLEMSNFVSIERSNYINIEDLYSCPLFLSIHPPKNIGHATPVLCFPGCNFELFLKAPEPEYEDSYETQQLPKAPQQMLNQQLIGDRGRKQ